MKYHTVKNSPLSAMSCLFVLCLSSICLAAPSPQSTTEQLQTTETNPLAPPLLNVEVSDDGNGKQTTTENTGALVDPELVASNLPEKEPSHCGNDAGNINKEPTTPFGDGEQVLLLGRQIVGFMPMYVLVPSNNNNRPASQDEVLDSSKLVSQKQRPISTRPSGKGPSAVQNNKEDDVSSMPPPSAGRPSYGPSSPMRPKMKEDRRRINIITNASPDLFNNRQKSKETGTTTDRKSKQQQDIGTISPIATDDSTTEETVAPLDLPRALPIRRSKRQFYRSDLPYYDPYYGPINYGYPDYYPDYDDYETDITIYV